MSMLSHQADELRDRADELRMLASGMDAPYIVPSTKETMALAMQSAASEMREAADTIENLRDRLQGIECPKDSEGQRIDVADTIHMLRSEYDGDHEWEDVVIELSYCKYGGDKWIVRGARGDAWACDCTVTGHDDELYDKSDDWENLPTPWDAEQPCFAMQADYEHCKYSMNRGWRDTSRYSELFGTPERAAQTLETVAEALYASAWADDNATLSDVLCSLVAKCDACPAMGAPGCGVSTRCGAVDYDMMFEWLRGDA